MSPGFLTRASLSRTCRFASPAAPYPGFPPKVMRWLKAVPAGPMKASATCLVAIAAPIGTYPLVSAFATTVMSGTTPQCSVANIRPVRPNPVMTSSQMRRTPYRSQISRTIAGLANLDILQRELLVRNAADMGGYLFGRLQDLYRYDIVGQVRG